MKFIPMIYWLNVAKQRIKVEEEEEEEAKCAPRIQNLWARIMTMIH